MKQHLKRLIPAALIDYVRRARAKRHLTSSRIAASTIGEVDGFWRARIDEVISSPDNSEIPRCAKAGKVEGYTITMHNGVRVCANGYYGGGTLNMLIENKGVHEPQEERAFEEIIRLLPERCVMLELGAYWGFYSLSLLQERPNATCYLVEPDSRNIVSGIINFRLNNRDGKFTQAMVGSSAQRHPKTISIDSFCAEHGIKHLHMLHADIQGYETDMLEGATHVLKAGKVDYVFISTHSADLHATCITKLKTLNYVILADADLNETFSYDGLIVAKHNSIDLPQRIEISKKNALQDDSEI